MMIANLVLGMHCWVLSSRSYHYVSPEEGISDQNPGLKLDCMHIEMDQEDTQYTFIFCHKLEVKFVKCEQIKTSERGVIGSAFCCGIDLQWNTPRYA